MSKIPLKTRLRSAIRREWLYSTLRQSALKAARVGYGKYICAKCANIFGPKQVDVDHIVQCTPKDVNPDENPIEYWGTFIKNLLYCGEDGLAVLCKEKCHAEKTKLERQTVKRKTKRKKR